MACYRDSFTLPYLYLKKIFLCDKAPSHEDVWGSASKAPGIHDGGTVFSG
jgi:hypothetical protein